MYVNVSFMFLLISLVNKATFLNVVIVTGGKTVSATLTHKSIVGCVPVCFSQKLTNKEHWGQRQFKAGKGWLLTSNWLYPGYSCRMRCVL